MKTIREQRLALECEQLRMATASVRALRESIPSFARSHDEDQWMALTIGKAIYAESDVQEMQRQAINLYYQNPIAYGIIETLVNFTIGKDVEITPADERPEARKYWEEFEEENDWDMKSKELVRRTLRDGEVFPRFYPSKEVRGCPLLRFIDTQEFVSTGDPNTSYGIETDPDDVEVPLRYYRTFYDARGQQQREIIPADEMLHFKIKVDSNVKRGVSLLVGIAPFITKYKDWLDDRIKVNRMRTMFNIVAKVTGSDIPDTLKALFPDSTTQQTASGSPRKQGPKSGGALLAQGFDWDFKNLNIAAGDAKDDGRAILMMIVAGTNLAEFMVTGDASNANYASTMVSESPAVRAIEAWQDFFEKPYRKIFAKVIRHGIATGRLPEDTNTRCTINFPIIIHRDPKAETEALAVQKSLGWVSDRTASARLGYDYEAEGTELERESTAQNERHDQQEPGRDAPGKESVEGGA